MPEPTWTKAPKPWADMTAFEREQWGWEVQADIIQDDMAYMSPNEIAAGLMADTEEYGEAASFRLAATLRKRASASSLGATKTPVMAPPAGPRAPPIRSRPVRLEKPMNAAQIKLL